MPNVLHLMNFSAAYGGNFLCSVLSLEKANSASGGVTVFMFPERARDRKWIRELSDENKLIFFQPKNIFRAASLIRNIIKEYNIQIVHSHFISAHSYIPLRIACIGTDVVHIFHAHSMPKHKRRPLIDFFRRRLINASVVLAVSRAVSDEYNKLKFNSIPIINGIDLKRLDKHELIPRDVMTDNPDSVILLMFGYDINIKGIDIAIGALDEYDTDRRFTLCICVANHVEEVSAEIKRLAGGTVPWIKILPPRSDVVSYFKSSDIFVSASRFEGLPYAVCEASYSGMPSVLSDISAHRELSIPGSVFFRSCDEKDLYEALCKMADTDVSVRNDLCAQAQKYVVENFSMKRWTDDIISIYVQYIKG